MCAPQDDGVNLWIFAHNLVDALLYKVVGSRRVGLVVFYDLEIHKLHPGLKVSGVACPFWVPLVEYNEADSPGA